MDVKPQNAIPLTTGPAAHCRLRICMDGWKLQLVFSTAWQMCATDLGNDHTCMKSSTAIRKLKKGPTVLRSLKSVSTGSQEIATVKRLHFKSFSCLSWPVFLQFLLPSTKCQPFNKTWQVRFEDTGYSSLDPEWDPPRMATFQTRNFKTKQKILDQHFPRKQRNVRTGRYQIWRCGNSKSRGRNVCNQDAITDIKNGVVPFVSGLGTAEERENQEVLDIARELQTPTHKTEQNSFSTPQDSFQVTREREECLSCTDMTTGRMYKKQQKYHCKQLMRGNLCKLMLSVNHSETIRQDTQKTNKQGRYMLGILRQQKGKEFAVS